MTGRRRAVVACGALALDVRRIARRRGWDLEVVPVPALLHNHPERIGRAVAELSADHDVVAVAYGDCGTYGALDFVSRASRRALLRRVRAGRGAGRSGGGAGDVLPDRLSGADVRAHGVARARSRPVSVAARRILPALHARGVAGAAADAGDACSPPRGRRGVSACRWSRSRSATPGSSASSSACSRPPAPRLAPPADPLAAGFIPPPADPPPPPADRPPRPADPPRGRLIHPRGRLIHPAAGRSTPPPQPDPGIPVNPSLAARPAVNSDSPGYGTVKPALGERRWASVDLTGIAHAEPLIRPPTPSRSSALRPRAAHPPSDPEPLIRPPSPPARRPWGRSSLTR